MRSWNTVALVKGTFFCVSVLFDLSPNNKNKKKKNNKVKCKLTLRVSKNIACLIVFPFLPTKPMPFPYGTSSPSPSHPTPSKKFIKFIPQFFVQHPLPPPSPLPLRVARGKWPATANIGVGRV